MIDVRITAYISPLAEQPQASLIPIIRVENVADEDATITGLIRIYRESTGTMIYNSALATTSLPHGTAADIPALTPFDPPEPADHDYTIKADITATSYLPGPPIHVSLGAWYFDIKTPPMGEAPAGHHVTHEDGGSDPVNVEDLPTTETDTTHRIAPDGGGGLSWVPARQLPLTVSIATSTTPTPDADACDQFNITALDDDATFGAPSGTPVDGQKLIIRILDDSTPRSLSWNAIYTARGTDLPTTTTADKLLYVGLIYNDAASTWDCVAVHEEA